MPPSDVMRRLTAAVMFALTILAACTPTTDVDGCPGECDPPCGEQSPCEPTP